MSGVSIDSPAGLLGKCLQLLHVVGVTSEEGLEILDIDIVDGRIGESHVAVLVNGDAVALQLVRVGIRQVLELLCGIFDGAVARRRRAGIDCEIVGSGEGLEGGIEAALGDLFAVFLIVIIIPVGQGLDSLPQGGLVGLLQGRGLGIRPLVLVGIGSVPVVEVPEIGCGFDGECTHVFTFCCRPSVVENPIIDKSADADRDSSTIALSAATAKMIRA